MICVICGKETNNNVVFKIDDIVIVPICKECKKKMPIEVIKLTAISRQIRENEKKIKDNEKKIKDNEERMREKQKEKKNLESYIAQSSKQT